MKIPKVVAKRIEIKKWFLKESKFNRISIVYYRKLIEIRI